jgi:hypothetical protein
MITLDEIRKEHKAVAEQLADKRLQTDAVKKKLLAEAARLKLVILYLETAPTEAGIVKQLEELERRKRIDEERFGQWCEARTGGRDELWQQYKTERNHKQLNQQIKMLKFILCRT